MTFSRFVALAIIMALAGALSAQKKTEPAKLKATPIEIHIGEEERDAGKGSMKETKQQLAQRAWALSRRPESDLGTVGYAQEYLQFVRDLTEAQARETWKSVDVEFPKKVQPPTDAVMQQLAQQFRASFAPPPTSALTSTPAPQPTAWPASVAEKTTSTQERTAPTQSDTLKPTLFSDRPQRAPSPTPMSSDGPVKRTPASMPGATPPPQGIAPKGVAPSKSILR